jgi:hypothetical protein
MEEAVSQFITDDELRARYGDEADLLIDALDRNLPTQKGYNWTRGIGRPWKRRSALKMDACPDCGASGNCAPGCPSRL